MQHELELQQIIYHLLKSQIRFGVYRCEDTLPTIKETSKYFWVSVDTIRLSYLQLREEGYISLSTGVGATVKIRYSDEEIRHYTQRYFAYRKQTLLDLAQSLQPLFHYGQWYAFKNASPETLDELEQIGLNSDLSPIYKMSQQLLLVYGSLNNKLLMGLVWKKFLFFQVPFLSIEKNLMFFKRGEDPLLNMVQLCRQKDWPALWNAVGNYQNIPYLALKEFYNESISQVRNVGQVDFTWNIYEKSSQICYSLCMELLFAIHQKFYPVGSLLPSPVKFSKEMQIGLNTVRRSINLLNKLGATQSINGVGTKVLPPLLSARNCDFSDATIQRRLLDFAQSFHILSLSCRICAKITVDSTDPSSIQQWAGRLEEIKRTDMLENIMYACYEAISLHAPHHAIRVVYTQLTQQFFWGFPLRELHGDRESTNSYFLPFLDSLVDCLNRRDAERFSVKLEELQLAEIGRISQYLSGIGIQEAALLVLPEDFHGPRL